MNADSPSPPADASRQIVITREFAAPRELVWTAMTDPAHVVNWWGPRGFRTEIETMDLRPGGVWKHTMIGPDGTRYPNKSVFREIVRPERIVYTHGGGRDDGGARGANFVATWTFIELAPKRTRVTILMEFASAEARERVVRDYGAIEGGKQTLERLGEHLDTGRTPPLRIARTFTAPRELVWQAWTQRERLMVWFGPPGFTIPQASLDLRPGGHFHYLMKGDDGTEMWGRFVFREIVPQEKLVWVNSFADPAGGLIRPPFPGTWPEQLLTTVTFAEVAGGTEVTVMWVPLDASDEEVQTFNAERRDMEQGWNATVDKLIALLAGK